MCCVRWVERETYAKQRHVNLPSFSMGCISYGLNQNNIELVCGLEFDGALKQARYLSKSNTGYNIDVDR